MAELAQKSESMCSTDYSPEPYCAAVVGAGAFPLVLAAVARARPYALKGRVLDSGNGIVGTGEYWEVDSACLGLLMLLLFSQGDVVPAESLAGVARLACGHLVRGGEVAEEFAEQAAAAVKRRLELAGAPPTMPAAAAVGTAKATSPEGPTAPFPAPTHVVSV